MPYFNLEKASSFSTNIQTDDRYFEWLNSQPSSSVLYISLGSFLSTSSAQMDDTADGLHESGVRFLWVARRGAERLQEKCGDARKVHNVEDWKTGCDAQRGVGHGDILRSGKFSNLIKKFMDSESIDRKEIMRRVKNFIRRLWEQFQMEGGLR
ncbi:hypothetical protein BUALT_Bualt02G0005400 [Buddleja alternifolia]|uniref:Uncharacterized protein n=1 Tax=Buddleja alternifolia TaxID=168488 RepID=A0AAV6XWZ5_9LAMI|nr:hypothetical protein BUALT_Bualt02G0005400 [Buddleja alternifolia]